MKVELIVMKNRKGFTLVELLATIVVLSLVIGITAYVVINAIGSAKVRHSVTIPLKVSDFGSGIDHSTFTKDDIEVNVGSSKVTNITLTKVNDDNYNLVVNSDAYNGKITLKIAKDKVLDKLKNGNEVISIDTGVTFDNTYKITYNANGGGAPSSGQ